MILFRYLFTRIISSVALTLGVVVFLAVVFDFLHKSWGYLELYRPSTMTLVQYYVNWIPLIIQQFTPIALAFGGTFVVVGMSRSGELSAMMALGLGKSSLLLPFFAVGLLCVFGDWVLSEHIVPKSSKQSRYVDSVVIRKEGREKLEESAQWTRLRDQIFTYRGYDPLRHVFTAPKIMTYNDEFELQSIIQAEKATLIADSNDWLLSDVLREEFDSDMRILSRHEESSMRVSLPIKPQHLEAEIREPIEMSSYELRDKISYLKTVGQLSRELEFVLHSRYGFRLAIFFLGTLGFLFGFRFGRIYPIYLGIFISGGLCLGFIALHSLCKIFMANDWLHPVFAGWFPVIGLLSLLSYRFWKMSDV